MLYLNFFQMLHFKQTREQGINFIGNIYLLYFPLQKQLTFAGAPQFKLDTFKEPILKKYLRLSLEFRTIVNLMYCDFTICVLCNSK